MTYRDRREAKADRLRGWAEKRETRAAADLNSYPEMRHDWAFITQPGRIPARTRMQAADDRAYASLQKAQSMASRADGIESQLAGAIYSDDPDAIERLRERIAKLEAERDQCKADNAAFRKAHRAELATMTAYQRDQVMPHRGYVVTNLTGNISKQRERLVGLETKAERERIAALVASGEMVRCDVSDCRAVFYFVPDADHPTLCRDHAKTHTDSDGFALAGFDAAHVRWPEGLRAVGVGEGLAGY
jgi:hypothetical protein